MYAKEEPLGLRMVLDGVTVLLPTIYDPSELRSDITGKLVRYLVDDGAEVEAGKPFAEVTDRPRLLLPRASPPLPPLPCLTPRPPYLPPIRRRR